MPPHRLLTSHPTSPPTCAQEQEGRGGSARGKARVRAWGRQPCPAGTRARGGRSGEAGGRGGGRGRGGRVEGGAGADGSSAPALPASRTLALAARAQPSVAPRRARASLLPPVPWLPRSRRVSGAQRADGRTDPPAAPGTPRPAPPGRAMLIAPQGPARGICTARSAAPASSGDYEPESAALPGPPLSQPGHGLPPDRVRAPGDPPCASRQSWRGPGRAVCYLPYRQLAQLAVRLGGGGTRAVGAQRPPTETDTACAAPLPGRTQLRRRVRGTHPGDILRTTGSGNSHIRT